MYISALLKNKTRSSAVAKRLCDCSVGQFWPNVTGRQHFAHIIGLSSTTIMQLASKAIEFGEIMQNKGYYATEDHSRSPMSVPIESPYATSY